MASHSVAHHLSLKIEDYDREIRRLVPYYDEFVAESIALLRSLVVKNARVLDLGSGTGRMARAILESMPEASVVLLDVDASALEQARGRVKFAEERATFVNASFFDPLPACDAVVASLSLHHVKGQAEKRDVYRSIANTLPEGAPFLCCDAVVSDDEVFSKLTFARWAEEMGKHDIDEATARRHFDNWSREEMYFSLHEELEGLKEAGFRKPECFWRRGPLAIYGGRRSS